MTTTTIGRNKTVTASGTLAATDSVLVLGSGSRGGHPGVLQVETTFLNLGVVELEGGADRTPKLGGNGGMFMDAGVVTNDGQFKIDAGPGTGFGGTLTVSGTFLDNNFLQTIESAATPSPSAGAISVTSTGSLVVSASSTQNGGQFQNDGNLTNSGYVLIEGGSSATSTQPSGANGTLNSDGVVTNAGTIVLGGGLSGAYTGTYNGAGGPGGQFNDVGVLTNSGSIIVQGGSSNYTSPGVGNYIPPQSYGGFGGILTVSGMLSNSGDIGLQASYSGAFHGTGGALNVTGALSNTGIITIASGTEGASFSVDGNVTNSGQILLTGDGGTPSRHYNPGANLVIGGSLSNTGTIAVDPNGSLGGTVVVSGSLINTGEIAINGSQTVFYVEGGNLTENGLVDGLGSLMNQGAITVGVGDTADISVGALVNVGIINVDDFATLTVNTTLTSVAKGAHGTPGTLTIGNSAQVTLNFVQQQQQVSFLGQGATLALQSANGFKGSIANPQASDKIDLINTIATAVVSIDQGLRVTLAGGQKVTLDLAQPLSPSLTPILFADGQGGTDIGFTAADFVGGVLASERATGLGGHASVIAASWTDSHFAENSTTLVSDLHLHVL